MDICTFLYISEKLKIYRDFYTIAVLWYCDLCL